MMRKLAVLGAVAIFGLAACSSDAKVAEPAGGKATAAKHTHSDGMTAAEMAQMSSTPAVDDRGFSKLENGMEHGHDFPQAIAKADRAELARQLTLAREVALQYPTVASAEAAGLRRAGPFSPGLGAHYISYGNALSNPDGVMSDDDIRKPLAWIYDGTHPDSHISGLFYMTGQKDATGFAGPNDTWHIHHDICLVTRDGVVDAPLGADHEATDAECKAVGGSLLKQTQYLLHAWVVPGYESPEGVFSHLSSTVNCDDGTFHVIDVTKTGDKTTICVDGSE
ncbi:MAG: hypothetical protein ABJC79_01835 [Acidimicrobiia bacterium]